MTWLLLLVASFFAGALNSVAGGGSFISFPPLLLTVPPVLANATNTVALWPATVASAIAYRKEMRGYPRPMLVVLSGASFVGGTIGAFLLLGTSDATFVRLLPWLLLVATFIFTFGGAVTKRLRTEEGVPHGAFALAGAGVLQIVIATYGGYFGGGMGIMMLATLALLGMTDIHAMNALKTILGAIINGVAVVIFVAKGAVEWEPGLVMIGGAIAGGYLGAAVARKIDPKWVKRFVLVVAWALTVYFFARAYGPWG